MEQVPLPGAWMDLDGTKPLAAKRLRESSEVLGALNKVKKALAAEGKPVHWVSTKRADVFFACIIVAYAALAGVDVEFKVRQFDMSSEVEIGFIVAQGVFMAIFVLELFLRIRAEGLRYVWFRNPVGMADAVIIVLGVVEFLVSVANAVSGGGPGSGALLAAGPMRMIRLLRLIRLIRILLVCKELKLLFIGMISSFSTVSWAFLLLLVFMYLGTLFCVILLGTEPSLQGYFGSVGIGLFTHFQIVTLEAWPEIADDVIEVGGPIWALYFVAFICTTSLAIMNLVTGVVCEKLIGQHVTEDEIGDPVEAYKKDAADFKEKILDIFRKCDKDGSGEMDCWEFMQMLERQDMVQLLDSMDISSNLEGEQLFEILDEGGKESLSCEEVAQALLRLRGSSRRLHSMMLQRDFMRCNRRQTKQVAALEGNIAKSTAEDLAALEASLVEELNALEKCFILAEHSHEKSGTSRRRKKGEKTLGDVQGRRWEMAPGPTCSSSSASLVCGSVVACRATGCEDATAASSREAVDAQASQRRQQRKAELEEDTARWAHKAERLERILLDLGSTHAEAEELRVGPRLLELPFSCDGQQTGTAAAVAAAADSEGRHVKGSASQGSSAALVLADTFPESLPFGPVPLATSLPRRGGGATAWPPPTSTEPAGVASVVALEPGWPGGRSPYWCH
mmetsp:Transcript_110497/g.356417  ORF Transcript_110497/g.356417 Transcript_110497/m.356417 type:complete len:678 (+) Transcript_110497:71-2104(+)